MLLAPLLPLINSAIPPTVFGVSGYSGAGTKAGAKDESSSSSSSGGGGRPVTLPKVTPESLGGGIRPYSLTDHIHEREAGFHLSHLLSPEGEKLKVAFIPSVAPWFQGIISTASVSLKRKVTAKEVKALFEEFYGGEPLVELRSAVPEIKDIFLKNGVKIGGFQVHSDGDRVVLVGVLDNLLKGAATQCLQNLNIALGYEETAGIDTSP
ncbi:unnamed protein product [Tilletia controversa]|nr:unnamed protein product [Tilletia controversa]